MSTAPTPHGSAAHASSTELTPCALEFAQLLHARQDMETRAQAYLADLQDQIRVALEQRGYRQVSLKPLDSPARLPHVAATATVMVLAELPLDGLKSSVFEVLVPLTVTYAGHLHVQGARINEFTVPETFVQPLTTDRARVADSLIQGLSQRYMDYLLQTGSCRTPRPESDPRRQYIVTGT